MDDLREVPQTLLHRNILLHNIGAFQNETEVEEAQIEEYEAEQSNVKWKGVCILDSTTKLLLLQ